MKRILFYLPLVTILAVFGFLGKSHGEFFGVNTAFGYGGGGGGGGLPSPFFTWQTSSNDPLRQVNLANLIRINVPIHGLVKLADDGDPSTQVDSAVYYVGADGKRHAFTNEKVYFTWYSDFSGVSIIGVADLASIPLGANVRYKPGVRMVKFISDPKVYAVDRYSVLRWITTEAVARQLYGDDWNRKIDDISDAFYMDYNFGTDIIVASDFNIVITMSLEQYISQNLGL